MNDEDRLISNHWMYKQGARLLYSQENTPEGAYKRNMPELFGPGCGHRKTDSFFDWIIVAMLVGISGMFLMLINEDPRPPLPTTPPAIERVVDPTLPTLP